jgi:hypothetical protein
VFSDFLQEIAAPIDFVHLKKLTGRPTATSAHISIIWRARAASK